MITEVMKKFAEQTYVAAPQQDPLMQLVQGAGLGTAAGVSIGSLYKPSFRRIMRYAGKGTAIGTLGSIGYAIGDKVIPDKKAQAETDIIAG